MAGDGSSLYHILSKANPFWSRDDLHKVHGKLVRVDISDAESLGRAVSEGRLNASLSAVGERRFKSSTVTQLKILVRDAHKQAVAADFKKHWSVDYCLKARGTHEPRRRRGAETARASWSPSSAKGSAATAKPAAGRRLPAFGGPTSPIRRAGDSIVGGQGAGGSRSAADQVSLLGRKLRNATLRLHRAKEGGSPSSSPPRTPASRMDGHQSVAATRARRSLGSAGAVTAATSEPGSPGHGDRGGSSASSWPSQEPDAYTVHQISVLDADGRRSQALALPAGARPDASPCVSNRSSVQGSWSSARSSIQSLAALNLGQAQARTGRLARAQGHSAVAVFPEEPEDADQREELANDRSVAALMTDAGVCQWPEAEGEPHANSTDSSGHHWRQSVAADPDGGLLVPPRRLGGGGRERGSADDQAAPGGLRSSEALAGARSEPLLPGAVRTPLRAPHAPEGRGQEPRDEEDRSRRRARMIKAYG